MLQKWLAALLATSRFLRFKWALLRIAPLTCRYMKYDDAEYYFLNFERELDNEAGGTHLGMYLAWAILRGLGSDEYNEPGSARDRLQKREATGQVILFDYCDGKLMSDDFNALGNAFTQAYYEKHFSKDFARLFDKDFPDTGCPLADACSLPDTWENFERMAAFLDQRFKQWQESRQRQTPGGAGTTPNGAKPTVPTRDAATSTPAAGNQPGKLSLVPIDESDASGAGASGNAGAGSATSSNGFDLAALKRRAEAGDAEAWVEIGGEFIIGERVPRDFRTAAEAFQKGADLGSANAMFNLGVCYQNGDGAPKDASRALHWFARAADRGHGQGLFMLGMAYRTGNGVTKDLAASNALMVIAHAKGVAEAGRQGVIAGAGSYAELGKRLSVPGQTLAALAERHGSAPGLTAASSPRTGASASGLTSRPAASARPGASADIPTASHGSGSPERKGGDLVSLALTGAGAASVFLLLLFAISLSGTPFRIIAYTLAWVGAFGVFRLTGQLGKSTLVRVLLSLAALVPIAGSFACIYALMLNFRKPDEH